MRPSQLHPYLDILVDTAKIPTDFWGPPGIGKTSLVEKRAEDMGKKTTVLIGSQIEPSDIGGMPLVKEHDGSLATAVTDYALPLWFIELCEDPNPSILFLDEINACSPNVQVAMLRLVQSRAIHGVKLPDRVSIVLAGNDPEHMELAQPLPSAMCSRVAHFDFEPADPDEQFDGETEGWPTPPMYQVAENSEARRELWWGFVRSFQKSNLKFVEDFTYNEGEVAAAGRGYPCNRSWTNLVTALSYVQDGDDKMVMGLSKALIGEAPASMFAPYVRKMDLPDPEEWLANPSLAAPLDTDDRTHLALASVVGCAVNSGDPRWYAAMDVVFRIAEAKTAGIATRAATVLLKNPPKRMKQAVYDKLAEVFGPMLLKGRLLPTTDA